MIRRLGVFILKTDSQKSILILLLISTVQIIQLNILISMVIAFGYPAEAPVIEDLENSVEYWKDEQGCLHVPKRKLADVIRFNEF